MKKVLLMITSIIFCCFVGVRAYGSYEDNVAVNDYIEEFDTLYESTIMKDTDKVVMYMNDEPIYLREVYLYASLDLIDNKEFNVQTEFVIEPKSNLLVSALYEVVEDQFFRMWGESEQITVETASKEAKSEFEQLISLQAGSILPNLAAITKIRSTYSDDFKGWYEGQFAYTQIEQKYYPHHLEDANAILKYMTDLVNDKRQTYEITFTEDAKDYFNIEEIKGMLQANSYNVK